jgi:hypothetical protein
MLRPCIVIYTPEGTCRIILSPFDDGIGHGQKPVYGNSPYTPLLLTNTSRKKVASVCEHFRGHLLYLFYYCARCG